jgi:hypothetical protein
MEGLGVSNNSGGTYRKVKKPYKIDQDQNYRRIVAGKIIRRIHWIPVLIPKRDLDGQPTGEYVSKNIPINCTGVVNGKKPVLDELYEAENKIITDSKVQSTLREQIRFLYVVINRAEQMAGKEYLGYDEYTVSIQKGLEKIETFKGKDGKILYKKIGNRDHVITKSGEGNKGTNRVQYVVTIDPEGIVDFTEGEMKLFEECAAYRSEICNSCCFIKCPKYDAEKCVIQTGDKTINLYDVVRPMELSDMQETFAKFPINLDAVDKHGVKVIKYPEAIMPILDANGLAYSYSGGEKEHEEPVLNEEPSPDFDATKAEGYKKSEEKDGKKPDLPAEKVLNNQPKKGMVSNSDLPF